MKSAIGIGSLLMDGLGDTLRISLTEDPELEIVPGRYVHCDQHHHIYTMPLESLLST